MSTATLSPAAGILHALTDRAPRTWCELAAAGLSAAAVLAAAQELARVGVQLHVSPDGVEIAEEAPHD